MSNCPHGVFLGVGCEQCPKPKTKISPEKACIVGAAAVIMGNIPKETDVAKKRQMQLDVAALVKMRSHYT